MKAVLEYTYPQDELKLKHALKGEDYYLALVEIDRAICGGGDPEHLLDLIHEITLGAKAE
jgi:hypothetical protein